MRSPSLPTRVLVVLGVAVLAAACGERDGPGPGSGGPTGGSPTGGTSPPTGQSTDEPTAPGPIPTARVDFTAGQATVEITGDLTETFDATLGTSSESYFEPERDVLDLAFENDEGRRLLLTAFIGEGATQLALAAIDVTAGDDGGDNFADAGGGISCVVTLTTLTPARAEGTFECPEMVGVNQGRTISVTGSFTAAA